MKLPWTRRAEIDEELGSHLRMAIADRIARGESPTEAEHHARREFGNELLIKETTHAMWSGIGLECWLQYFRYALRQMRRTPGFTAIAVLTLGLGLGAVTSLFAIVNSVLLEPLKYAEPQQLYSLVNLPPPGAANRYWLINGRHFYEWRAHCQSCEDIGMAESIGLTVVGPGEPERFSGLRVSYNFFRTLGVRPALGRDFRPEEELPGQFHELILAESVWRARFSSDPGVIGRVVQVSGEPYTVVGVMPADFRLPAGGQWGPDGPAGPQPVMFRPLGQDFSQARPQGNNNYFAVVRLKAGVTRSQVEAELNALIGDFIRAFKIEPRPTLLPLHATVVRDVRPGLLLLLGIGVTMLLIVCVNTGNLMLVRTASRDREVGIRLALGASQARVFVLLLNESLVLVLMGATLGAVLAAGALQMFATWAPASTPRLSDIHAGARVWLFSVMAAAASTIVCGLLPAWRMARTDPQISLKATSLTATVHGGHVRFRELLVCVEVALSTVLLVIGALFMLSFLRVLQAPKGFAAEHVITQDVSIGDVTYHDADRIRFADDALQRLASIPGVMSVGLTNQLPLRGETWICGLRDAGPPDHSEIALANFRFVSQGYWDTLGVRLQKGRPFQPADRERHVAVLSERSARLLWPGQDPIGKRIGACSAQGLEVVGVVGDVRAEIEHDAPLTVYQPYWVTPMSRAYFVVRTREQLQTVAVEMRTALHALAPTAVVGQPAMMSEIVNDSVGGRRFQVSLVMAFAVFALLLASLGIYGVISFSVARRTPELGIRLALGARASSLAVMVIRRGMMPVFGGLAAGVLCALIVGRLIATQLYGVTATDPWTIGGVAMLLIWVGLGSCLVPARRAMRINPLRALRFE